MRNFDMDTAQGGAGIGGGSQTFSLTAYASAPGFTMSFARNEEIYGEGEPSDFVYKVISGAVRTTRILSDGRRQIADFHLAGDVFGLEVGATHSLCAEAITDCRLSLVKRNALERAADHDCAAARELRSLTAADLHRLQEHMLLLGRKGALERVATFLLDMAQRENSSKAVDLPMSRSDIADYLGLTIETVSRSMTHLEREGVVYLPSARHVELRDRRALEAYAA